MRLIASAYSTHRHIELPRSGAKRDLKEFRARQKVAWDNDSHHEISWDLILGKDLCILKNFSGAKERGHICEAGIGSPAERGVCCNDSSHGHCETWETQIEKQLPEPSPSPSERT